MQTEIELTCAQAIRSLPPATIGTEYFWTGVGVVYMARPMFSNKRESKGGLVNERMGSGTPAPVASTGISSYFSKLMPVCCFEGSAASPKSSFSMRKFRPPATCLPSLQTPYPKVSRVTESPPRAGAADGALQLDGIWGPAQLLLTVPPRGALENAALPLSE